MNGTDNPGAAAAAQRVDLWLWHARFAPSRTQASNFVRDGRVRINKIKAKRASALVRLGDVITFTGHRVIRVVRVDALSDRRLGASAAVELYTELGDTTQQHG
ncbi:MAG: RNA-binding S4 domain-containing protein [Rhodobiaceae bacterium]|nr:RNA-binding S4 domain-containing protein [Rhodobiaceae bacterium]MCC0018620.1 RNA-binding S4 domain-containing protein [Rhodobiaceae bacterium]MCC0062214.1 RNA-binding S4 domain-containing protein [Rhodobiaceae bacterium]